MKTTYKKPKRLIRGDCGWKVGWEYYKTRKQAEAQVERVQEHASMMQSKGYDFGYQVPGSISEINHSEYGHCFELTVA